MSSWCALQHQKIVCTQLAASRNSMVPFFSSDFFSVWPFILCIELSSKQWGGENLERIEGGMQPKSASRIEKAGKNGDEISRRRANKSRKERKKNKKAKDRCSQTNHDSNNDRNYDGNDEQIEEAEVNKDSQVNGEHEDDHEKDEDDPSGLGKN